MDDIEYVGRLFSSVQKELIEKGILFSVLYTHSTNERFSTDNNCLYIIRQQMQDNVLIVTVAAKMGKEVS